MSRRVLPIAAVALALLVVGAGVTVAASSTAQPERAQTITVSAVGTAETPPDQMTVQVAVEASGDNAAAVRQQVAANASQLRSALHEIGISDDQIRTTGYDLSWDDDSLTYNGHHTFTITVTNPKRTGTVIDTAVRNGADTVENVRFTLSEETRRSLRTQALQEAMDAARGKADTLARSAGMRITGVHTVQTGARFDRPHPVVAPGVSAEAMGASTHIESGPVRTRVQVQVVYNATAA